MFFRLCSLESLEQSIFKLKASKHRKQKRNVMFSTSEITFSTVKKRHSVVACFFAQTNNQPRVTCAIQLISQGLTIFTKHRKQNYLFFSNSVQNNKTRRRNELPGHEGLNNTTQNKQNTNATVNGANLTAAPPLTRRHWLYSSSDLVLLLDRFPLLPLPTSLSSRTSSSLTLLYKSFMY